MGRMFFCEQAVLVFGFLRYLGLRNFLVSLRGVRASERRGNPMKIQ